MSYGINPYNSSPFDGTGATLNPVAAGGCAYATAPYAGDCFPSFLAVEVLATYSAGLCAYGTFPYGGECLVIEGSIFPPAAGSNNIEEFCTIMCTGSSI